MPNNTKTDDELLSILHYCTKIPCWQCNKSDKIRDLFKKRINSEVLQVLDRLQECSIPVLTDIYPTGDRRSIDGVPTEAIAKERANYE